MVSARQGRRERLTGQARVEGGSMKAPKLGLVATLSAAALVLVACGSDSDSGSSESNSDIKICMYTHGDGGAFWSVAKKGAEKAAEDLGVELDYQESNNDPAKQAELIEAGITGGCTGIAVSAPNPDAIKGAMAKATEEEIPLITMNSGSSDYQDLGAMTHVGQDELIAGQQGGERLKELGATKVLCPIQEANNIGLQQRCDGAKETFGNVVNLQLSSGLADLTKSESEIQAKLKSDTSIDGIFSLNSDIATGASLPATKAVGREIVNGTVDLSGDAIDAIKSGELAFAIDQQQYAQGYLPVVMLYLNEINGMELGGGQPVYTGPGFVTKENADLVEELAKDGTR
jgi:simple sugar transport system substrate-binding protein